MKLPVRSHLNDLPCPSLSHHGKWHLQGAVPKHPVQKSAIAPSAAFFCAPWRVNADVISYLFFCHLSLAGTQELRVLCHTSSTGNNLVLHVTNSGRSGLWTSSWTRESEHTDTSCLSQERLLLTFYKSHVSHQEAFPTFRQKMDNQVFFFFFKRWDIVTYRE